MIDVNIKGVMNGIEVVLPGMRARKMGTIINISSVADREVRPEFPVYAATKAAVIVYHWPLAPPPPERPPPPPRKSFPPRPPPPPPPRPSKAVNSITI